MRIFVQIGATREGGDPYQAAARARNFSTVLVARGDDLIGHELSGAPPFNRYVAVEQPRDPRQVIAELKRAGVDRPALVLAGPGFDGYTECAYAVAEHFRAQPLADGPGAFRPMHKIGQRQLLGEAGVAQPPWLPVDLAAPYDFHLAALALIGVPAVLKPADKAGGYGVTLIERFEQLRAALASLRNLTNVDYANFLLERYAAGREYSVQGIARNGAVEALTVCEKIVFFAVEKSRLLGFREAGHIAYAPSRAPAVAAAARSAVESVGFLNGPFHVDVAEDDGTLVVLELGFRLSGMGVTELVERTTGRNWADESFGVYLDEAPVLAAEPRLVVGQMIVSDEEAEIARRLARGSAGAVRIELEPLVRTQLERGTMSIAGMSLEPMFRRRVVQRVIVSAREIADVSATLERIVARRIARRHKPIGLDPRNLRSLAEQTVAPPTKTKGRRRHGGLDGTFTLRASRR